jgi:hypothetical protein
MTSGSIGSGSLPVIPAGAGEGAVDVVEEGVEVEPVPEAKARLADPASNTRSKANASLRVVCLNMKKSPFPAQMCAGRRLGIVWKKTDAFLVQVAYRKLLKI